MPSSLKRRRARRPEPLASGSAAAETPAQAAAAAEQGTASKASTGMTVAEAKEAGYKVPPRAVEASEVIKLAEKQVGISEGKGGQTKFHDWYVSTPHAKATAQRDGGFSVKAYNGAQWCDMFVSWLGAQTGVKNMGWDAYTVQHASWFKDTDRWGKTASRAPSCSSTGRTAPAAPSVTSTTSASS